MKEKRPALVSYIVDLNFLNAFLLIISLFPKFTKLIGIITPTPTFFNVITRVLSILMLLIISYGLLRLKRWGYLLMIAYNMFFLIISIVSLSNPTWQSSYNSSFIISILGLMLSFSATRYFIKAKTL